jgi:rSAM/selenodomain-associated transferase 2
MISVVIPTYNDESLIASTIYHLKQNAYQRLLKEIIVVDGGSTDATVREAEKAGATVVHSIKRNRSAQMNLGVQYATGKILYFIMPGCMPPKNFTNEIVRATQNGYSFGTFRLTFDYKHWILRGVALLSKFKKSYTRLETQSLFVLQELFVKAGAFREDFLILEDQELIKRLKRYSSFVVLRDKMITTAKKFLPYGVIRAELSYLLARIMYWMGYPQTKLVKAYNKMLGSKATKLATGEILTASFN